jgi:hypothetical protein
MFRELQENLPCLSQFPHPLHRWVKGILGWFVENEAATATYPPNCSVNLLISLFKSLSLFLAWSIFSTECKTVV